MAAATALRLGPAVLLAAALTLGVGCATHSAAPPPEAEALRVSDAALEGDATRRASLRLVLQGLDEDEAGKAETARSSYERAIQIDSTNPYAYLALARLEVDEGRFDRALEAIDQAELLFGDAGPGVEAHLAGLRGAASLGKGYGGEAGVLLDEASRLAPGVWADGHLSAAELR